MNRFLLMAMLASLADGLDADGRAVVPPGAGGELGAALTHVLGWAIEVDDSQALDVVVIVAAGSRTPVLAKLILRLGGEWRKAGTAAVRGAACCRVLGDDRLVELVGATPRLFVDATPDANPRLAAELDHRARCVGGVVIRPPAGWRP